MTRNDPVLACLAKLPAVEPAPELSDNLRAAAYARLRPRPVHPGFTVMVLVSVVSYLSWAVHFSSGLY